MFTGKRCFRQGHQTVDVLHQVIGQTILIAPALFGVVHIIFEKDLNTRAQHGFGFQQVCQPGDREARTVKKLLIRPEMYTGAGIAFAALPDDSQFTDFVTIFKGNLINLSVTADSHFSAF